MGWLDDHERDSTSVVVPGMVTTPREGSYKPSMSNICLQFGQCGNQVGLKFLDTIYKSGGEDRDNFFYTTSQGDTAHCILVDTENKVINDLLNGSHPWIYQQKNAIFKSGGSGNNWALGYCVNGPDLAESVIEKLRLECEKTDFVKSIITFLSIGGGTGSGVGTYIVNKLKDIYPDKYIITNLTVPFLSGVSPVHLYNSVLSLSHLIDSSDAIIMFYNDFLFKQCQQLFKENEFKFVEMNSIISKQLATLFHTYNGTSFIPDCIHKLIPTQNFKLISLKSFPYAKDSQANLAFEPLIPWKSLLERLKSLTVINSQNFWDNQNVTRSFSESKQKTSSYYRAIGNIVMCRGKGASNALNCATASFDTDALYSDWSKKTERFTFLADNSPVHGQQQFACIATNSAMFNYNIESMVDKSWKSFTKNAYLHHYEKYGLTENDFSVSFLKMENLLKYYKSL